MFHDLGKMGIPDSILLKPGRLTPEEENIMRAHPTKYSKQRRSTTGEHSQLFVSYS
jgi:HD-GYP domain-containing protein (c-di-GMP phosphodiesterase class II)